MKVLAILIVPILILTTCLGSKADYGNTINDHLMSKAPAGYFVEILDLEELSPVTVANSIALRQTEFEDDRDGKIKHFQGVMSLAGMLPEGADRQRREEALQHKIDSLENAPVPAFYDGAPADKVLAIPVRCRYSVSIPGAPMPVIETFDFWLSPDEKTVLHQKKAI
jgi:hypothetical protein